MRAASGCEISGHRRSQLLILQFKPQGGGGAWLLNFLGVIILSLKSCRHFLTIPTRRHVPTTGVGAAPGCGISLASSSSASNFPNTATTKTWIIRSHIATQGGGGAWLLKFLGVIILSFGFRLFERRRLIYRHAAAILGGVAFAVVSSLLVTALAARLLQLPPGVLCCQKS